MSTFEIDVDLTEVMSALDAYGEMATESFTRSVAQAGAQVFYDTVKHNVPRETKPRMYKGKPVAIWLLSRSIYQAWSRKNSPNGVAEYHVSWNHQKAPHGHNVEFGHGGPRPAKAVGFMRRSYESAHVPAMDAMMNRFDEELAERGL